MSIIKHLSFRDVRSGKPAAATDLVEVAPGVFSGKMPRAAVPRYGLVRVEIQPNGQPALRLQSWCSWLRTTLDIGDRLGVPINRQTIIRLARAGFIRWRQPSPGTIYIDPQSFYDHMEASSEPGFWTAERVARFADAREDGLAAPAPGRARNNKPKEDDK